MILLFYIKNLVNSGFSLNKYLFIYYFSFYSFFRYILFYLFNTIILNKYKEFQINKMIESKSWSDFKQTGPARGKKQRKVTILKQFIIFIFYLFSMYNKKNHKIYMVNNFVLSKMLVLVNVF